MHINQFLDGGTGSNTNIKIQKEYINQNTSAYNKTNNYIQNKSKHKDNNNLII